MARELADVLHYFLEDAPARAARPAAPLLALPVAEGDALRASFVWNLAVELARTGARPVVAVPTGARFAAELVPDPPLGGLLAPQVARPAAGDLAALAAEAAGLCRSARGPVLALLPPAWIEAGRQGSALVARSLLFTRPDDEALCETAALGERLGAGSPGARVGVTLHGVGSVDEARAAWGRLGALAGPRLRATLASYGTLLDDLDVYRGLTEGRAVGLARPQSRAARALADVARLLLEDSRAEAAPA